MNEEVIDTAAPEPVTDADQAPDRVESEQAANAENSDQGTNPEASAEGLADEAPEAQAPVVPESYATDGLTVSDDMELDMETVGVMSDIAKEIGLSQENFNLLYNKLMPALNARQDALLDEARAAFIKEAKADPEMGGARWSESLALARKTFLQYTDEPTRELLKASGLDCHPGVIRAFYQIGKAVSDDTVVRGSQAVSERDAAKAFFYNSKMN